MKPRTVLLHLALTTMAASASGQALIAESQGLSVRPLNLTLPKQAARDSNPAALTGSMEAGQARRLPLDAAGSTTEERPGTVLLPYGAGYESRQSGGASGGGSGSGGGGGGGNGGGRGSGGQGGMGRGR